MQELSLVEVVTCFLQYPNTCVLNPVYPTEFTSGVQQRLCLVEVAKPSCKTLICATQLQGADLCLRSLAPACVFISYCTACVRVQVNVVIHVMSWELCATFAAGVSLRTQGRCWQTRLGLSTRRTEMLSPRLTQHGQQCGSWACPLCEKARRQMRRSSAGDTQTPPRSHSIILSA